MTLFCIFRDDQVCKVPVRRLSRALVRRALSSKGLGIARAVMACLQPSVSVLPRGRACAPLWWLARHQKALSQGIIPLIRYFCIICSRDCARWSVKTELYRYNRHFFVDTFYGLHNTTASHKMVCDWSYAHKHPTGWCSWLVLLPMEVLYQTADLKPLFDHVPLI